jgi:hypothetical protein
VYSFDHVVRNSDVSLNYALKGTVKVGGPGLMVHGDYAMKGGPMRRDDFALPPKNDDAFRSIYGDRPLIPESEMKELRGRRFAIINLWRSITEEPCVDLPLAFCDTQTTSPEDYIVIEFRYVDRQHETYLGGYNEKQRWYYYPELLKDEGILIKTYDSQGSLWKNYTYEY